MSANAEQVKQEPPPLHIGCKRCGGNAGRIEGGALVYTVKHSGEHHTVRIDLRYLEKLLLASRDSVVNCSRVTEP